MGTKELNKIAGYRNMLQMNQTKMGELLGISKQAYSKKERGIVKFNDKEKLIIKNLILPYFPDISIDELFF